MNCKLSEGAIDGATLGTKLGASLRSKLGTSLGTKLGKSLGISETGPILGAIVKTTVSLPTSSRTRLLHGHQKLLGKNAPPASAKFSSTNSTLASQTCVEMEEEKKTVESVRKLYGFSSFLSFSAFIIRLLRYSTTATQSIQNRFM